MRGATKQKYDGEKKRKESGKREAAAQVGGVDQVWIGQLFGVGRQAKRAHEMKLFGDLRSLATQPHKTTSGGPRSQISSNRNLTAPAAQFK